MYLFVDARRFRFGFNVGNLADRSFWIHPYNPGSHQGLLSTCRGVRVSSNLQTQ